MFSTLETRINLLDGNDALEKGTPGITCCMLLAYIVRCGNNNLVHLIALIALTRFMPNAWVILDESFDSYSNLSNHNA